MSSTSPPPTSAAPAPATPDASATDKDTKGEVKKDTAAKQPQSSSPSTPAADDAGTDPDADADTDKSQSDVDDDNFAPTASSSSSSQPSSGTWQAIWSPGHNAYYFYNSVTQETTWTNPLQPSTTPPTSTSTATEETPAASTSTAAGSSHLSHLYQLQAAAAAQGIDPSLAHLDPSLVSTPAVEGYTAKFNARTGAFTRPDGRDPSHLSEFERAKRMSEFYFDVNQWQEDVEARKLEEAAEAAEGKKRKRPTKKDLEKYREQKKAKKIAKTAWLRT